MNKLITWDGMHEGDAHLATDGGGKWVLASDAKEYITELEKRYGDLKKELNKMTNALEESSWNVLEARKDLKQFPPDAETRHTRILTDDGTEVRNEEREAIQAEGMSERWEEVRDRLHPPDKDKVGVAIMLKTAWSYIAVMEDNLNLQKEHITELDTTVQYLVDSWPVPTSDGGITLPNGDFLAQSRTTKKL